MNIHISLLQIEKIFAIYSMEILEQPIIIQSIYFRWCLFY